MTQRRYFDLTRDLGAGAVDSHRILLADGRVYGHENITVDPTHAAMGEVRPRRPHPDDVVRAVLDRTRREWLGYQITEVEGP